jgi:hypothetical protein
MQLWEPSMKWSEWSAFHKHSCATPEECESWTNVYFVFCMEERLKFLSVSASEARH